jgi:hypothetical protein
MQDNNFGGYLDKDAWESSNYNSFDVYSDGKLLTANLKIHFIDREGKHTDREVILRRYVHDGTDGILLAHCRMRDGNRPFAISRISNPVDLDTGELIPDLIEYLDDHYANSTNGKADAFIEAHYDALICLFYVCKADDAFRSKEKQTLQGLFLVLGLFDIEVIDCILKRMTEWTTPSRRNFHSQLKKIEASITFDDLYKNRIFATAKAIVATDKNVRATEVEALELMSKLLKIPKPKIIS